MSTHPFDSPRHHTRPVSHSVRERALRVAHRVESTGALSWDGDEFCAKLVRDKKVSGPLNLDHTLIKKGTAKKIETILVETGYDAKQLKKEALSDHKGLLSRITLL